MVLVELEPQVTAAVEVLVEVLVVEIPQVLVDNMAAAVEEKQMAPQRGQLQLVEQDRGVQ
jgi:hypothetical protein